LGLKGDFVQVNAPLASSLLGDQYQIGEGRAGVHDRGNGIETASGSFQSSTGPVPRALAIATETEFAARIGPAIFGSLGILGRIEVR